MSEEALPKALGPTSDGPPVQPTKPSPTGPSEGLDAILIEARGDLDLPGETGRQTKIFVAWFGCLVLALILSSIAASRVGHDDDGVARMFRTEAELAEKRAARVRIGLPVGLLLPAILTWIIHFRHRRGGGHARGIYVDVTHGGEFRIWGRGYGSRVTIRGAQVQERLVDVYAGRLGAWRQRRLKVLAAKAVQGSLSEIEIATPAIQSDLDLGLRAEGGEGDCVELSREDFLRLRDSVFAAKKA